MSKIIGADEAYAEIEKENLEKQYEKKFANLVDKMFPPPIGEAIMKVLKSPADELERDDYRRCAFATQQFCLGATHTMMEAEQKLKACANLLERSAVVIQDDHPDLAVRFLDMVDQI